MRGIKILGTAKPGEVIRIEARIAGRLAGLIQSHVSASANGQVLMEGDLTLSGIEAS